MFNLPYSSVFIKNIIAIVEHIEMNYSKDHDMRDAFIDTLIQELQSLKSEPQS